MLYGTLWVDFYYASELLYPNLKIRLRLIRARPNYYMLSDHRNVSLRIVNCSLYTRRIALKHDYFKKRMDMPAYTPVEYNLLETLARTFIFPARQNQFIQQNISNKAVARRITIAINKNSAFTGSYNENSFWYQKVEFRQIRTLRGGQLIVDFVVADNFCFYVTTMKAMHFQEVIPQFRLINSKTTLYSCLIWLRCKMLLKIALTGI